jgi:Uma2 family endonuclease
MVRVEEVGVDRWLFTLEEYHRLGETGFLTEDDRVELIEGELIRMPPIGSNHASVVDVLAEFFIRGLVSEFGQVRIQNPVVVAGRSEVQPDLVVAKPRPDRYRGSNPTADDVLLVVEVADSTLRFDRQVKLPLYAGAGVPEVWIVNLVAGAIDVFRRPNAGQYQENHLLKAGDQVSPAAFPDLTIAVSDILG